MGSLGDVWEVVAAASLKLDSNDLDIVVYGSSK